MRLVLANGVFDLLHPGHVRHLEEAAQQGDYLVVSVTIDEMVKKGRGRPIQTLEERMEMLRALRCVNSVAPCGSSLLALLQWCPTVFVKGHDRKGKLQSAEEKFCKDHGIEIFHTKPSKLSTTKLIERIKCA